MKRNIVFDYNTLTTDNLKETHNIKVLSYFFFEFMKFNIEEENRPYDVAFIGSKNERREDFLNLIKQQYPELNVYVDFEWKHSNAESLTKILQQCKVILNIPYYKENPLKTHRINKALACGCDVISLKSCEDDANSFYKDYCVMTDDIIGAVGDYFKNKPEKKSYEELVKTLSQKFNPHMCFIIDHVHKNYCLYLMEPKTKLYTNKSPPLTTCPPTKQRKSHWETKFEKDYPYVKWTPRDLSLKFMIPIHVLKPMIDKKAECIKYIYENV